MHLAKPIIIIIIILSERILNLFFFLSSVAISTMRNNKRMTNYGVYSFQPSTDRCICMNWALLSIHRFPHVERWNRELIHWHSLECKYSILPHIHIYKFSPLIDTKPKRAKQRYCSGMLIANGIRTAYLL